MSVTQDYLCARCQAAFDLSQLTETKAGWLCPTCALPAYVPPARSYKKSSTRLKKKQASMNWPVVVVVIGGLIGGGAYLVTSGTLAAWTGSSHADSTQVGDAASTELQTVNRLIHESNDATFKGDVASGKSKLMAARELAMASADPKVKEMLPQIESGVAALDGKAKLPTAAGTPAPGHSEPGALMADK